MTRNSPTQPAGLEPFFEWIAEICVRFHGEYDAAQGVGAHLLAAICPDPDDPSSGSLPHPEESARSAFEVAIFSSPLPAEVAGVLREIPFRQGGAVQRLRPLQTRRSPLGDIQGAVSAVQSVVQASNSPLAKITQRMGELSSDAQRESR
ncbi:hypothetical protein [Phaeobacter gallaeciensis]|uniref:hypothetical protein n=1 Tax=Phaeobacter gallaeciensis TaxID=60890 RepID=UPI00237FCFA6|nr:hypothetical protein [Phaeobacter gallaeciensis]MDE4098866.1 hypothetical protein [Phaeobacter gallaeciensis]MDE4107716.1 hypothetical protein [Phaeobacter gallaeciensis]MDE4112170.1 hypothetical protein [Phaeobacter gallaeciensis]MDE4116642.1 hypothetical protein [Phaeobacter gallaeciensis]MDE4121072.1 hypothetical protein [Phaeobacter gallaeciensis]